MSKTTSLSITQQEGKKLSVDQLLFNKLNDKINKLSQKLEEDKIKYNQLLCSYNEKIEPKQSAIAKEKINAAKILHHAADKFKLTKKQQETFSFAITYLFEVGFSHHEPTTEERSIFDFWSPITLNEMEEKEIEDQKVYFKQMMEMFDFDDIDVDEFDPKDPEKIARMIEQLKDAQQKKQEGEKNKPRKKSKRELKLEQEEKAMQEIQKKSLREIYISLAKVLHPDSNETTVDFSQKEELMKQVTLAYNAGDLAALLQIEAEWIAKQENDINKLSTDKLKVFINLLKKRVIDLESEHNALKNNPRFIPLKKYAGLSLLNAEKKINRQTRELDTVIKDLQLDNAKFERAKDKDVVLEFATYIKQIQEDEEHMKLFDLLFD